MVELTGKKAPPFTLQGTDGRTHSLSDYAGRVIVIYFYPRDDTPGCTKEACAFRDLHGTLRELDVALLGVSRDSLFSHDKFIAKFGLPFTLLSDPEAEMMKAYGAYGEKISRGKSVTGTIRSTVAVGPDGKVLRHWVPVRDAAAHPREVLDFIKEKIG